MTESEYMDLARHAEKHGIRSLEVVALAIGAAHMVSGSGEETYVLAAQLLTATAEHKRALKKVAPAQFVG